MPPTSSYIVAAFIHGAFELEPGRIVLLTVFRKTRQHEQHQIDRAVRAEDLRA